MKKKFKLIGNIISENEYRNGMFLPQPGYKVRFDSGKYNGIYEVTEWIFSDSTHLLRIKVRKIPTI